jgi:hypothetical protein
MIERGDLYFRLSSTLKLLEGDVAALERANDVPPEQIEESRNLLADWKSAMNAFFTVSTQRTDEAKRAREWQEILPACSLAKEKFEAAGAASLAHNREIEIAQDGLSRARRRLDEHVVAEPNARTYPSAKTLRKWSLEKAKLEKEVESRQQILRDLREQIPKVAQAYQAAKEQFEQLARREMALRPPEKFPEVVPIGHRLRYGEELTPAR